MQQETAVLIVGGGPAGLATSACLNLQNIPNIVLEKEDCCASLWKKRSYDRLKLHLAKQFCELPQMPFPQNAPTFMFRTGFIQYLDNYASHFNVNPIYHRTVESASFDERERNWLRIVRNTLINVVEKYMGKFLIIATGPSKGPLYLKRITGRSPVIDVGTLDKSKHKKLRFFHPSVRSMEIAYNLLMGKRKVMMPLFLLLAWLKRCHGSGVAPTLNSALWWRLNVLMVVQRWSNKLQVVNQSYE
ncbi:probable indole-3-pyruvate monooxygenase YUCCA11 [Olea europaea subsp. europaea]|uniref:indole-3-pyruvate monooxygenase n=1 Tax=Olea europaea subsp. europaea TaxID=158383 RepID=A0A8S0UJA2_OLEEU|nr:probable indole-3-pyruvate monooxygenase YUCCA11 [Olea europaea subsp. europaea]